MKIGHLVKHTMSNMLLMLAVFLGTLPWTGPAFVATLRFILEGLNSFGAGR